MRDYLIIIAIEICIQIILAVVSLIKYIKIKKVKSRELYFHKKKSHLDIYFVNFLYVTIFLILDAFFSILLLCFKYSDMSILGKIIGMVIIGVIIILITNIIEATALYMVTEIKHLSPNDGIGKRIWKSQDLQLIKDSYRFYVQLALIGFVTYIALLIQVICLNTVIAIVFVGSSIFLYYFGMADVLQHNNYNSDDYGKDIREKSFTDKFYISNIIMYFKDENYHKNADIARKDNTANIINGMKAAIKK